MKKTLTKPRTCWRTRVRGGKSSPVNQDGSTPLEKVLPSSTLQPSIIHQSTNCKLLEHPGGPVWLPDGNSLANAGVTGERKYQHKVIKNNRKKSERPNTKRENNYFSQRSKVRVKYRLKKKVQKKKASKHAYRALAEFDSTLGFPGEGPHRFLEQIVESDYKDCQGLAVVACRKIVHYHSKAAIGRLRRILERDRNNGIGHNGSGQRHYYRCETLRACECKEGKEHGHSHEHSDLHDELTLNTPDETITYSELTRIDEKVEVREIPEDVGTTWANVPIEETTLPNFDSLCSTCYNAPLEIVLKPCGHMLMCYECHKKFESVFNERKIENKIFSCPTCQNSINDIQRIFRNGIPNDSKNESFEPSEPLAQAPSGPSTGSEDVSNESVIESDEMSEEEELPELDTKYSSSGQPISPPPPRRRVGTLLLDHLERKNVPSPPDTPDVSEISSVDPRDVDSDDDNSEYKIDPVEDDDKLEDETVVSLPNTELVIYTPQPASGDVVINVLDGKLKVHNVKIFVTAPVRTPQTWIHGMLDYFTSSRVVSSALELTAPLESHTHEQQGFYNVFSVLTEGYDLVVNLTDHKDVSFDPVMSVGYTHSFRGDVYSDVVELIVADQNLVTTKYTDNGKINNLSIRRVQDAMNRTKINGVEILQTMLANEQTYRNTVMYIVNQLVFREVHMQLSINDRNIQPVFQDRAAAVPAPRHAALIGGVQRFVEWINPSFLATALVSLGEVDILDLAI